MIRTHIDQATAVVRQERDTVERKQRAYERFGDRVRSATAAGGPRHPGTGRAPLAGDTASAASASDRCRELREAFAETVRPACEADDSTPLEAIVRRELGDGAALLLSPSNGAQFTPDRKRYLTDEIGGRQSELTALERVLEAEAESLATAGDLVDGIAEWIVRTDETPLTDAGFDDLSERHERLAAYRRRCEEAIERRQKLLQRTVSADGRVGLHHRPLVESLYADLPVTYPALATLVRLQDACRTCQRAVRAHLTRRA